MNEETTKVREEVSEAYAEAISRTEASCCQPACCATTSGATNAERLGYSAEQLAGLQGDVAESTFGCGSPLAFAEVREGETVLDLGSGAGLDLLVAAKAVGPTGKVIGVDMTDAMLERARANIARAGVSTVEVRKGIIEALPVDDASVDWVISNCVINLSPEKERVFAEVARVLKPGGRMRVSDIVVEDLPAEFRARRDLLTACVAGAVSEADYLAGLSGAGLVDVEVVGRHVYDAGTIQAFLESDELPATSADQQALSKLDPAGTAAALTGKVASLVFVARKPAP